jgi:phospholipase C
MTHFVDSPIKHIVLLMLENRSFDQMLGCMPGVDGVSYENANEDSEGNRYHQQSNAQNILPIDPPHSLRSVLAQLNAGEPFSDPKMPIDFMKWLETGHHTMASLISVVQEAWRRFRDRYFAMARPMSGFVKQFATTYPERSHEERQQIMSYFARGRLPALHALAEHFTICDRWFSSVPGPTWANRLFLHSGTSAGTTWMPHGPPQSVLPYMFNQRTIYDELAEHKFSWRVYFHDFPQVLALANMRKPQSRPHIVSIEQWEDDLRNSAMSFPFFSFIEPAYFDFNVPGNDDHPPHDTQEAQNLISQVYNTLRKSAIWDHSLLIITYDEHGGFYDHVTPDSVIAPDDLQDEYNFNQYGVRVPALLVSPYASKSVYKETLDHTSIGAYLVEQFGISPLGARMADAKSFSDALTSSPDNIGPESIPSGIGRVAGGMGVLSNQPNSVTEKLNENQIALDALSKALVANMPARRAYGQAGTPTVESLPIVEDNPRSRALRFLRSSSP